MLIKNGIPKIEAVFATEILDSRGDPSVRAFLRLADGSVGCGDAPSGASTGKYEAVERRDGGGGGSRYGGRGVLDACAAVNGEIASALLRADPRGQRAVDKLLCELDGTSSKYRLGANAILPVSIAYARACAASRRCELYESLGGSVSGGRFPIPMMNILNGGRHAANNVDIQEFMIVPVGGGSAADAVRIGAEVYRALGGVLHRRGVFCGVGDEGGYSPSLARDEDALDLIMEAVSASGHENDAALAVDAAASEWTSGSDGVYRLPKRGVEYTSEELILYYRGLCERYPIVSVEDGLGEDDGGGWRAMTDALGDRVMLVGDDLFVTNAQRIAAGARTGAANAVLIKPNQAGTVTETWDAVSEARRAGYKVVVSHRSGDTEDSFIADLAVAAGADFIKSGAPCRAERTAKYNRLIEIYR